MFVLGLNYSQMHDSSACLIRDGQLLFAVAEERISRLKHDARFPYLAIQACLDFAKLRPDQIDEVCVGWQSPAAPYRHDLKLFATPAWALLLSKCPQSHAPFRQHVAPARRLKSFFPPLRSHQSALPFRRSPSRHRP